jgi:dTDP-glucose 4,6-dehydratase
LIPLFINNIIQNKPLPVYGDGKYTRDWLFVEDHAVTLIWFSGVNHDTYNIDLMNGKILIWLNCL